MISSDQSGALYRFSVDHIADPLFWIRLEGTVWYANHKAAELSGYGREELTKLTVSSFISDITPENWLEMWERVRQAGCHQFEAHFRKKDNSLIPVAVSAHFVVPDGQETLIVSFYDISDRKKAEERLELAQKVYEASAEGVMITDAHATILSINAAFTTITGYSEEEVVGQQPSLLKSKRHNDTFYAQLWTALITEGKWSGEIWNRRKSGEAYPEHLTITAITDDSGDTSQYVAVFHDLSELKRSEEEIEYKAYHDALTGLPNRQLFIDRLKQTLIRSCRQKKKFATFFIDVDNFKKTNDTLGHSVGDLLLQGVAIRLVGCAREGDTVSRLGGDEFSVIMDNLGDEREAAVVAQRIVDSLGEPFNYRGNDLKASVSVGIVVYPTDGDGAEALIKNGDIAMYHAKDAGKNTFQFFRPSMTEKVMKRQELERDLRNAIEAGEMQAWFQPKIDITTEKLVAMEALVRWVRPDGVIISPGDFIPVAEETGLITRIDEQVLRLSCDFQCRLPEGLSPVPISINLCTQDLERPGIVSIIEGIILDAQLPVSLIDVEVTESAVITNVTSAVAVLNDFRERGFDIAIDDFGTGYSSLSYLTRFPITTLKIDRSFVIELSASKSARSIANAIVVMAHELGMKVVAEGVETEAQLNYLRSIKCDQAQGYYYSKPLPPAEMIAFMR